MQNPHRRHFLKISALSAGAMLVSVTLPLRARSSSAQQPVSPQWCVYVSINRDNTVVMQSPIMEMGQFMRTAGPMILADEMDLDWSLIRFDLNMPTYLTRNRKGDLVYDHAQVGTGGSQTLKNNWTYLRTAGATIRRMMIEEAAERWDCSPERLTARLSQIIDTPTGRKFSYGDLAEKAARRQVDTNHLKLKQPAQFHIMGKNQPAIDARDIVTGAPLFGIDENYANALQVAIDRAPAMGAQIASYDKKAALAVPGVRQVVEMPHESGPHWPDGETQLRAAGVAVLADSFWAAMRGKDVLKTTWKDTPQYAGLNSKAHRETLKALARSDQPGKHLRDDGEVTRALQQADKVLEHCYERSFLAHACMEPLNCIADVRKDSATVVVGHQWPHAAALAVEEIAGIDALKVEVINKRMGGGFGRKGEADYLREAIWLSHEVGQPVQVIWTRENDMERDFFAPAAAVQIRAGVKQGRIHGWHMRHAQTAGEAESHNFPAHLVRDCRIESLAGNEPFPLGTWRGPRQMQQAFAIESMLDELAHAAAADPLAFRLALMEPAKAHPIDYWAADHLDSGRMARCYRSAAEMAGWGRKLEKGEGLGIAGHVTFGTYVAFVLQVHVDDNKQLSLQKAWGAIDCGFAVNPNHIRAQMEGGLIDGLNAALFNEAVIEDSQVQTRNFGQLRWMRMGETPLEIETEIIESDREPTGVGEPPVPPAPAALANAIFAASGLRLRRMPFSEHIRI
ncbi:molybdopterin-dependent oxidoreductase [Microbulbifer sp. SH-1]|uniref:xanthine dehydrogenase family protein molybdopterin-binding subunit n=1 Tax=Microbulbifer sp. SH-1 TaxID=2681547 RepID=UPI00140DECDB|nr:molybdopterin cofactor-binding domain-containing protein [Microbulbifer sp. SH-1]QIL88533.1 molybdopterin-dependent oxidoreductase [Microbulbifer sp. SH-1]